MHRTHATGKEGIVLYRAHTRAFVHHKLALVRQREVVEVLTCDFCPQVLQVAHEVGKAQTHHLMRHGHGAGGKERSPVQGPFFPLQHYTALSLPAVYDLHLLGYAVAVVIEVEPGFIDLELPQSSAVGVRAFCALVIQPAPHLCLRHVVGSIHGGQFVNHLLAVPLLAQVGSRLYAPVSNEAGTFHVAGIGRNNDLLTRNRVKAYLLSLHFTAQCQIIENALRSLYGLHVHARAFFLGCAHHGESFSLRKAGELAHLHFFTLRAMGKAPAHTLIQSIRKHVVYDIEHISPEYHLIDV